MASVRDPRQQSSCGQRLAWGQLRLLLEGLGVRLGASHTPCRVPPASGRLGPPQVRGHVNGLLSARATPQLTSPAPGMRAPGPTLVPGGLGARAFLPPPELHESRAVKTVGHHRPSS